MKLKETNKLTNEQASALETPVFTKTFKLKGKRDGELMNEVVAFVMSEIKAGRMDPSNIMETVSSFLNAHIDLRDNKKLDEVTVQVGMLA